MADPVDPGNPPQPGNPNGDDWFESLSPDLKVEKSLQSFRGKSIGDVVKSYVEAQRLIGGSIRLPKSDAPPEEQERFYQDIYNKLGRPESPDKYGAKRPTLPDGTPWDAEGEKAFLETAHKHGLNTRQAQGLLDWYGARLAAGMQNQQAQIAETERLLRQEWGQDYDRKLSLAQRAAGEVGGKEYVMLLEQRGIANHPIVLRAHAAYGEPLAEQKIISPDIPGQPTSNEAKDKLNAIFMNKEHPYFKGDQKAAEEVQALIRQSLGAEGRKVIATV